MGYLLLIFLVLGLAATYPAVAIAVALLGGLVIYQRWRQRHPRPVVVQAMILDMPKGRASVNVVGRAAIRAPSRSSPAVER